MTDHISTSESSAAYFSGGRGFHDCISPAEYMPPSEWEIAQERKALARERELQEIRERGDG